MRTTVTLDHATIEKLMRTTNFKSKAKAVTYAIEETLRKKELEKLEKLWGKCTFDRRVLKWRHLAR